MRISKRTVDGLRPKPSGDTWLYDSDLKGFAVRMKPSGSASFIAQYRLPGGKTKRLLLGRVGEITPDQARDLARKALAAARSGDDPAAARHERRHGMTVADVCARYFEAADAGHVLVKGRRPKKASTLKTDRSRIACHVIPLIGHRVASGLTSKDIEALQRDIVDGKAARPRVGVGGKVTGGRGAATRTIGAFGGILSWAKREGLIPGNPVIGVLRHADGVRKRALSDDELRALGAAMRTVDEHPVGLACIRLFMLTPSRKSELLTLTWPEVDAGASCLRLGDTKAGAQMRPIGRAAVDLLRAQPRYPDSDYVFPSIRYSVSGHFVGAPKLITRLCAAASIKRCTLHTLRHTFATVAATMGYSELTISALMGHSRGTVTSDYIHLPDPLLVSIADAVSARIVGLLDDNTYRLDENTHRTSP